MVLASAVDLPHECVLVDSRLLKYLLDDGAQGTERLTSSPAIDGRHGHEEPNRRALSLDDDHLIACDERVDLLAELPDIDHSHARHLRYPAKFGQNDVLVFGEAGNLTVHIVRTLGFDSTPT